MQYFEEIVFHLSKAFSFKNIYFGLILNEPLVTFPIVLICMFLFSRRIFGSLAVLILLSKPINKLLKFVWQVPINPDIASSAAWAFPSGHTAINTVIWVYLCMFVRNKWFYLFVAVLLFVQFYSMVYFQFHTWDEIMASLGLYSILTIVCFYIIERINYNLYLCSIVAGLITLAILMFGLPDNPQRYVYVWRNLGALLSLSLCFYMFSKDNIKSYKVSNKFVISSIVVVFFITHYVAISMASPSAISYILNGLSVGVFVYIIPSLDKVISKLFRTNYNIEKKYCSNRV